MTKTNNTSFTVKNGKMMTVDQAKKVKTTGPARRQKAPEAPTIDIEEIKAQALIEARQQLDQEVDLEEIIAQAKAEARQEIEAEMAQNEQSGEEETKPAPSKGSQTKGK